MTIRRETAADRPAVLRLIGVAFDLPAEGARPASDGSGEVRLTEALWAGGYAVPALSLVADPGAVVGHVLVSRAHVGTVPVVALGPIAVAPDQQRRGVGSALVHAVLGAADATGEPLVGLLGDPARYRRFGFRPASAYGIAAPDPAWGDHFQVRTLSAYDPALTGAFRYAAPFDGA